VGTNDKAKSDQGYQQSMNILGRKFGKDALHRGVTERIKNVDLNQFGKRNPNTSSPFFEFP